MQKYTVIHSLHVFFKKITELLWNKIINVAFVVSLKYASVHIHFQDLNINTEFDFGPITVS